MRKEREAGVLLHITSLPGNYGVGTLGKEAYAFADYLKSAGMKLWQILPLGPTSYGDSPYQSVAANALNYYLINLESLIEDGLLTQEYCDSLDFGDGVRVNYSLLYKNKLACLKEAYHNYDKNNLEFKKFIQAKKYNDFALFMTIKELNSFNEWQKWPLEYQNYSQELENEIINRYQSDYEFWLFTQFIFVKQWQSFKHYVNSLGIELVGDIPLYLAYDSVEVWKYPELFDLNAKKEMNNVAGCPPDGFSEDGQLWGNPVYNWELMRKDGYSWWKNRIKEALEFVDVLRIDHFRGFEKFYAIPYGHINARFGHWVDGPKMELFKDLTNLNIIAEDLGLIDDEVRKLLRATTYPGMKILEFAFDGNPLNEHKPSNCEKNFVVYTGTHDNLPLQQYFLDLDARSKQIFLTDLKKELEFLGIIDDSLEKYGVVWSVIRAAFNSVANTVIIPMQDLLCQGAESRMNEPSTVSTKNWSYRVEKTKLTDELKQKLLVLGKESNRC